MKKEDQQTINVLSILLIISVLLNLVTWISLDSTQIEEQKQVEQVEKISKEDIKNCLEEKGKLICTEEKLYFERVRNDWGTRGNYHLDCVTSLRSIDNSRRKHFNFLEEELKECGAIK